MAFRLNVLVKKLSGEHGDRLIFSSGLTNPRDQLGKNGVAYHNWFTSFFYNTITVRARVGEGDHVGGEQVFYLNYESVRKYLQAHDEKNQRSPQHANGGYPKIR